MLTTCTSSSIQTGICLLSGFCLQIPIPTFLYWLVWIQLWLKIDLNQSWFSLFNTNFDSNYWAFIGEIWAIFLKLHINDVSWDVPSILTLLSIATTTGTSWITDFDWLWNHVAMVVAITCNIPIDNQFYETEDLLNINNLNSECVYKTINKLKLWAISIFLKCAMATWMNEELSKFTIFVQKSTLTFPLIWGIMGI